MFSNATTKTSKVKPSYTNTSFSKEETIHSNSHLIGLPTDRTAVRTGCKPNGQPSDRTTVRSTSCPTLQHLFSVLRVAYHYAIELFRLTLLSSAPFNPSTAVSILDPFLLYALLGVTYVTYTKSQSNTLRNSLNANRYRMYYVT